MNAGRSEPPRPRRKLFKLLVSRIFMFVLGRGFQSASGLDPDIQREIEAWPEGYVVMFKIKPHGPCLVLEKRGRVMVYRGEKEAKADVAILFRNIESAFMMLTAQIGTPQAFSELRANLKGDLAEALRFIRCLTIVETYLFPYVICERIMKRVPRLGFRRVMLNRGIIYLLGIPFGKPSRQTGHSWEVKS